jgi:hypothetical protein
LILQVEDMVRRGLLKVEGKRLVHVDKDLSIKDHVAHPVRDQALGIVDALPKSIVGCVRKTSVLAHVQTPVRLFRAVASCETDAALLQAWPAYLL